MRAAAAAREGGMDGECPARGGGGSAAGREARGAVAEARASRAGSLSPAELSEWTRSEGVTGGRAERVEAV